MPKDENAKEAAAPEAAVVEVAPTEAAPVSEPPPIQEVVCKKCGESVSGPNVESVKSTMERHARNVHGR